MNLMTPEAAARLAPAEAQTNDEAEILSYSVGECALGQVLVAHSGKGVCAILIGADHGELQADLAARFPQAQLVASDDLAKVLRFVEAPAEGLHLTLDLRGTPFQRRPFQRRVWERLRAIPVGRTVTYRELARWISPLASARAVASACAANPIALAIPCHRVVRSDGDLADYRWGIERKRIMLRMEAMA